MADKKKKPVKKPDGRGKRPRDVNQLAFQIMRESTSPRVTAKDASTCPSTSSRKSQG